MKHTKILQNILVLALLFVSASTFAQDGWNWGSEPQKAKEKYTLFSDDVNAGNFDAARKPFTWLLVNTPDLNKSLYMKGADVYEGLVKATEDGDKKSIYEDSALVMYDLRIKYFQDEANVLNRKGGLAMTYLQDRPEKYPELFELYKKIVELNGNDAFYYNVNYVMYLAGVMFKSERFTEEEIIALHEKLTKIVDTNIAKDDAFKEYWAKAKEYIDSEFAADVTLDCDKINKFLMPKLAENPDNVEMIEQVLAQMLKAKCLDDPKFLELAIKLSEAKPSFGRISFLYKYYLGKGDNAKGLEYLKKAEGYAESAADKADLNMIMAGIYRTQGDKSTARSYYQKAAATDASKTYDAYTGIGDLYMGSSGQCTNSNPVLARAVFIAAFNAYNRAGNGTKAAQAQQQFPSREAAFNHGGAGTTVNVGCWIGETVTIPSLENLPKR